MSAFVFSPTWHSRKQYEAFYAQARFIVLACGRRYGKTTGGMTHAADGGLTRMNEKYLWVDVTQGNIEKYVNEIMLPMLPKKSYKWDRQQKILTFLPTNTKMHFGSAEKPETLEGFGYQRVYLNEAGIILKGGRGEHLWYNTIRPMTIEEKDGARCQVFFLGTPKGKGLFKTFADNGYNNVPNWRTFNFSTYDNPLLPREEIDQLVKEAPGKIALQEIFGEFIDEDEGESVIDSAAAFEAAKRKALRFDEYETFWGVDVAMGGNDLSALSKRNWKTLLEPTQTFANLRSDELAEKLRQEFEQTERALRPREILVDETGGWGAGVVDQGRRLGLPIYGVNVARKATDPKKYFQYRDELWWAMREWVANASLNGDIDLVREMIKPNVDLKQLERSGKWKVEAKDEMMARLGPIDGKSPNRADSLMLTFACGIETKADREEFQEYAEARTPHRASDDYDFMGA